MYGSARTDRRELTTHTHSSSVTGGVELELAVDNDERARDWPANTLTLFTLAWQHLVLLQHVIDVGPLLNQFGSIRHVAVDKTD